MELNQKLNLHPIIIAGILMLILGLGGGYLIFSNKTQMKSVTQVSPTAIQQPSPTSNLSPTSTNIESTTVEQNAIKMTISPTHGPAGTKVKISIVGIVRNPNAPYATITFLATNGIGKDSTTTTYTFDTTKISQSGAYETIYIIPNSVLTSSQPGDQSLSKEVPIGIGDGNITFSYQHPTFHDISIKAPFTVTSD